MVGESIPILVLANRYTNVEVDTSANHQYQCYPSSPDGDASLTFGRTAPIPRTSSPEPTEITDHSVDNVKIVEIEDSWDEDTFGSYYCKATKDGRDDTKIPTFFVRSDGMFA